MVVSVVGERIRKVHLEFEQCGKTLGSGEAGMPSSASLAFVSVISAAFQYHSAQGSAFDETAPLLLTYITNCQYNGFNKQQQHARELHGVPRRHAQI